VIAGGGGTNVGIVLISNPGTSNVIRGNYIGVNAQAPRHCNLQSG
jgi:hypothetical protein